MAKKTAKKSSKKSNDQLHFAPLVVLALAIGITIGVLFWGYTRPDKTEVHEELEIIQPEDAPAGEALGDSETLPVEEPVLTEGEVQNTR